MGFYGRKLISRIPSTRTSTSRRSKNVKIICSAPKGSHEQVLYPAAVIKGSPVADSAKDFIKFIKTPKVKAVFEKYGFTPAE